VDLIATRYPNCNTLQHAATRCNIPQFWIVSMTLFRCTSTSGSDCNILQHIAIFCNTLQHWKWHSSETLQQGHYKERALYDEWSPRLFSFYLSSSHLWVSIIGLFSKERALYDEWSLRFVNFHIGGSHLSFMGFLMGLFSKKRVLCEEWWLRFVSFQICTSHLWVSFMGRFSKERAGYD